MKNLFTLLILIAFMASVTFADDKPKTQHIAKANNAVSYNFTTGADKYYGGANGAKEIEAGVWGMIAGDANADGTVNASDYNDHWLPQNGTTFDYSKTGDFNLDGNINATDYNDFWLQNNGKATQVPDNGNN